jgi:hypothetical protein
VYLCSDGCNASPLAPRCKAVTSATDIPAADVTLEPVPGAALGRLSGCVAMLCMCPPQRLSWLYVESIDGLLLSVRVFAGRHVSFNVRVGLKESGRYLAVDGALHKARGPVRGSNGAPEGAWNTVVPVTHVLCRGMCRVEPGRHDSNSAQQPVGARPGQGETHSVN